MHSAPVPAPEPIPVVTPAGQVIPRPAPVVMAGRLTGRTAYAVVLAMVLALASLLVLPLQPANAHDELISSTPATGATIEALPAAVELTLSNPPSGLGAAIIVTDSTGTNWSEGPVSITNNIATQPLRAGAPAGNYTVQWRVVSADSHPIEGTFPFTASEASGTGSTEATEATESAQGAGPEAFVDGEVTVTASATDESPGSPMMIVLAVVVLGLLGIGALVLITRKNLKAGRQ